VKTRLEAYREQTAPVLEYYRRNGNVRMIDAVGTVEEIAGRVKRVLGR
jgi:adenylate kinase